MPDAARKWLESYEKCLVKYRDTPPKQFRGRTPSTYDAVAHLRRLLEDNERLEAEVTDYLKICQNYADDLCKYIAGRSDLVAYVRAKTKHTGKFTAENFEETEKAWQALSDELKELIDE